MKQKVLIFLITCFLFNHIYSQNPSENLNKYWNYRNRLKSKFMVSTNQWAMEFGRNGGVNIPANAYNPTIIESPLVETSGTARSVKWGDATCSLGYYIAVLATEYKLLSNYEQDVIPTLTELVFALHAIERLDWHAEGLYGCGNCQEGYTYGNQSYYFPYTSAYGGCLNGFFIRDDVPRDFATYWAGKGYTNFAGLDVHSDMLKPDDDEESEDQVWNLLVGLALVKDLVDYSGNITDGDGTSVTFKKCAQKITHRLINYMMNPDGAWSIQNPCTGNFTHRGGIPADLLPNAYYFAEAGNWITDKQFGDYHQGLNPTNSLPLPYGRDFTDPFYYNDNAKFALSTISGISWAVNFDTELYWTIQCSAYYNNSLPDNKNDAKTFAFEHFPLLNILLHNHKPDHTFYYYYMSFIENLLNLAPLDGPFRYIYDANGDGKRDGNDYPVREWSTHARLTKPIGISLKKDEDAGEYNGLDYMLLHNLYWLVYNKNLNTDKYISDNYPYRYTFSNMSGTFGEQTDPTTLTISTLKNITADNIIGSNGKVIFRAGNSITLNAGFKIESGASFTATIDPHSNLVYAQPLKLKSIKINNNFNENPFIVNFLDKTNTDESINGSYKVYPNPSNGVFNIGFLEEADKSYEILLFNQYGLIVKHYKDVKGSCVIDISQSPNGIYIIEFIGNGFFGKTKLVKL